MAQIVSLSYTIDGDITTLEKCYTHTRTSHNPAIMCIGSIVNKSPNLATTQMSINNKRINCVYSYNGLPHNSRSEQTTATHQQEQVNQNKAGCGGGSTLVYMYQHSPKTVHYVALYHMQILPNKALPTKVKQMTWGGKYKQYQSI